MGLEFAVLLLDLGLPFFMAHGLIAAPTITLVYLANAVAVGVSIYRLLSPVYAP